jgi:hypothetical protein
MDEITVAEFGCNDFIGTKTEAYKDTFYAYCSSEVPNECYWKECKGKKVEHWRRFMFEFNGAYTDARTGVGISEKTIHTSNDAQIVSFKSQLEQYESERGLSPLYTDVTKLQVVRLKN